MDEEFKKLLAENLARSQEVYEVSRQLKRYLFWGQILATIRLVIIVIPIILAIIYLPPFLRDVFGQYQDLFPTYKSLMDSANNLR